MRRLFPLMLSLILLCALCAGALPAQALDVTGLRMGTHPDKTRVVIELGSASAFRSFVLADPVRLVVDLPQFDWRVGNIGKPRGTGVRDIRQGPLQPGISRIVIDLERPSLIRSAFLIPKGQGQPDRIVIDFGPASPGEFAQGLSRTFGALRVNDPGSPALTLTTAQPAPAIPGTIAGNLGTFEINPDSPPPAQKPSVPKGERPLIVLDPGHGGDDPGAIGSHNLKEKNITLAMAKDLKRKLEDSGRYRVILTREKDVFIRLSQRVAFARAKKADLFISLHADSINRSGVRGASIYTLSEKASDAETEKLAARENHADMIAGLDLSAEDEDVADILVDLTMRDTMNQSKFFANKTVGMLKGSGIKTLENPHRYAGFAVLKAPDIPSVLLEMGYMSNAQESALLSDPAYRDRIAAALVGGIDNYFETLRH